MKSPVRKYIFPALPKKYFKSVWKILFSRSKNIIKLPSEPTRVGPLPNTSEETRNSPSCAGPEACSLSEWHQVLPSWQKARNHLGIFLSYIPHGPSITKAFLYSASIYLPKLIPMTVIETTSIPARINATASGVSTFSLLQIYFSCRSQINLPKI